MSEPSEPSESGQDFALAPALKRAADVHGLLVPVPVARIKALGIRRRRRVLATAAACVVCVLGGGGVLAAAHLEPDPRPGAPVEPTPTLSCLTASPPDAPVPGSSNSSGSSAVNPPVGSGPTASAGSARPPSSSPTSHSVTISRLPGSATNGPSADSCGSAAAAPDVTPSTPGSADKSTAAVLPPPGS